MGAGLYGRAFLWTCLLEAPFYWAALRYRASAHSEAVAIGPARFAAILLTINLCTHPLVCLGFPQMAAFARYPDAYAILGGELFAPLVEGALLAVVFSVPAARAAVGALIANLASWTIGCFLGGWLL